MVNAGRWERSDGSGGGGGDGDGDGDGDGSSFDGRQAWRRRRRRCCEVVVAGVAWTVAPHLLVGLGLCRLLELMLVLLYKVIEHAVQVLAIEKLDGGLDAVLPVDLSAHDLLLLVRPAMLRLVRLFPLGARHGAERALASAEPEAQKATLPLPFSLPPSPPCA